MSKYTLLSFFLLVSLSVELVYALPPIKAPFLGLFELPPIN